MYIANFYCHELKLVIEIDGGIHNREDVKTNDTVRENDLTDFGIKVIRFTNDEIKCTIDKVIEDIKNAIKNIKSIEQLIKEDSK